MTPSPTRDRQGARWRRQRASSGTPFWPTRPVPPALRRRQPATRWTTRPRRCCSTLRGAPACAVWPQCAARPICPSQAVRNPCVLYGPCWVCGRAKRAGFCRQLGLAPLLDHTNDDTRFPRNKLRRDVIPILESINPNVTEAISRLARTARGRLRSDRRRLNRSVQRLGHDPLWQRRHLQTGPCAIFRCR